VVAGGSGFNFDEGEPLPFYFFSSNLSIPWRTASFLVMFWFLEYLSRISACFFSSLTVRRICFGLSEKGRPTFFSICITPLQLLADNNILIYVSQ